MSVGGADHRIPQCNHLTLFGSAVSVVEFPPYRKFLCWTLQKFPVRSCFTVYRLSFCRVLPPALKGLQEDRYHCVRATPLFIWRRTLQCLEKGNLTIRELSVFRRSLISKLLILRSKDCICDKTVSVPRPFW